ncbi:hypothetical protein [Novosphingobium panipatense]|uniref:hypothetical protein n=1 Tax=Novosphingobium panipatense TaxID=428991 RepID=UPI003618C432
MAFFAALFLAVSPARAQLVPEPAASASAVPVDPFGRGTPRSTITGLINALAQQDYDRAAFYFDLPVETNPHAQRSAAEFARRLQALLDSGGSLTPFSGLSNDTPGSLDDDLPLNRERVGTITVNGKPNPVLLGRKEVDGHTVWRVPVETMRVLAVAKVPQPGTQATEGAEAIAVAGAPVQDWMVLAGLAVLSFGGLWILSAVILAGAALRPQGRQQRLVSVPVRRPASTEPDHRRGSVLYLGGETSRGDRRAADPAALHRHLRRGRLRMARLATG